MAYLRPAIDLVGGYIVVPPQIAWDTVTAPAILESEAYERKMDQRGYLRNFFSVPLIP
jgi:hypothetical protein